MDEFELATRRGERRRAKGPEVIAARYDSGRDRIVVELSTGDEVAFSPRRAQGLEGAGPADLDRIELTPSGLGLHFPKLDADLWLPAVLEGVFGSRQWMAAQLGALGGKVKSRAKARAARANGKLGGRPRKTKRAARPRKVKSRRKTIATRSRRTG